jgi:FKBP-type peptidyl-prolyl cis-trans isomerase (trigger factor)
MVQEQLTYIESRLKQNLARQGMGEADQTTMLANRKAETAKSAEREIRLAYLTNAIGTEEKIEVSDAEVTAKVTEILDRTHPSERAAYEKAITEQTRGHIRADLREKKVMDWIIQHAKIKEETGGTK